MVEVSKETAKIIRNVIPDKGASVILSFPPMITHDRDGRGTLSIRRTKDNKVEMTSCVFEDSGTYVIEEILLETTPHLTSFKILENISFAHRRESYASFNSYPQYKLDDANSMDKFIEKGEPFPYDPAIEGNFHSLEMITEMFEQFVDHLDKTKSLMDISPIR